MQWRLETTVACTERWKRDISLVSMQVYIMCTKKIPQYRHSASTPTTVNTRVVGTSESSEDLLCMTAYPRPWSATETILNADNMRLRI